METSGDATPFNDPSLMSMVHFLRTNKDCARLRMRQRWFATKKDAGRKDKDAEAKDPTVKGDIVRKEHEEVAGGDVDDDYDEGGESGSIPMELLEHVKKAVKEFQASMATTGKRSFFLPSLLLSSFPSSHPLLLFVFSFFFALEYSTSVPHLIFFIWQRYMTRSVNRSQLKKAIQTSRNEYFRGKCWTHFRRYASLPLIFIF